MYPSLTRVMVKKLCLVATSVPSERVFSKTAHISSERRNRLKQAKVGSLVFLNANEGQAVEQRMQLLYDFRDVFNFGHTDLHFVIVYIVLK